MGKGIKLGLMDPDPPSASVAVSCFDRIQGCLSH